MAANFRYDKKLEELNYKYSVARLMFMFIFLIINMTSYTIV